MGAAVGWKLRQGTHSPPSLRKTPHSALSPAGTRVVHAVKGHGDNESDRQGRVSTTSRSGAQVLLPSRQENPFLTDPQPRDLVNPYFNNPQTCRIRRVMFKDNLCCKYTGSCCAGWEDYFYFHTSTAATAQATPSSCHTLLPHFQPNEPCISL